MFTIKPYLYLAGREQFQLGSLSHYINARANGYHDLPMFPDVPSDSSVRDVEPIVPVEETRGKKQHAVKKHSFYSESEQSSPADEGICLRSMNVWFWNG